MEFSEIVTNAVTLIIIVNNARVQLLLPVRLLFLYLLCMLRIYTFLISCEIIRVNDTCLDF